MVLQFMWVSMVGASLLYGCVGGRGAEMLPAALDGTGEGIALTLQLGAGYLLFCGLMQIARALQVPRGMNRLLRPLLQWLMPGVQKEETRECITMNLSMNLLGMGNAATPMGVRAVGLLDEESRRGGARHDLYMFLILNATGLQLLPTTVLTLRAGAGSADVNAVLLPTLACTAVSTLVGVGAGMLCRRWEVQHA